MDIFVWIKPVLIKLFDWIFLRSECGKQRVSTMAFIIVKYIAQNNIVTRLVWSINSCIIANFVLTYNSLIDFLNFFFNKIKLANCKIQI